jgi:hypothetical protein
MKNKLYNLFFFFLLIAVGTKAQPIITAAGFNPVIGDSYKLQNTKIVPTLPSFVGGGQVWDFSSLTDSGQTHTYSFVSPIGLPEADSFPTSNIACIITPRVTGIEYFKTSDSLWGQTGYYSFNDNGTGIPAYRNVYTPLFPWMVYPMSYITNYTNSIVTNYITDYGYSFSYAVKDTIVGLGYGSLKLPTGNFDSVLCVYKTGTYLFVANGIHFPLLTIQQANDSNGNPINGSWQVSYNTAKPLPIEISAFTASWQNKLPYLNWSAVNTNSTKSFNIQRSVDGHAFTTVGQVGVNSSSSYHFVDNYVSNGTIFYRLQQLDKNGQTFYSNTCQLSISNYQISIYPNPTKGLVHVSVPRGNPVQLMIYDVLGKLIYENKTYTSGEAIATNTWGKGTYIVRIKDDTGWKISSLEKN